MVRARTELELVGRHHVLAAGFLLENGSDGLAVHVPEVELPREQVAALVVAPSPYGGMMFAYREAVAGREPADRFRARGAAGGLHGAEGETAAAELDEVAASNDSLEQQLIDSHFERLSESLWRYNRDDTSMTAVLRDGKLSVYWPADTYDLQDVIRGSEIDGVVQLPLYDEPVEALRLDGEWMSYTLVAPSIYPVDAEMTRPATTAELGLPEIPRSVEPSGFVVGGENDTETIRGLTELNGHSVEHLEARMRPAGWDSPRDFDASQAGFLGRGDDLRRTMARDNDVVRKLGLTHAEVGESVRAAGFVAARFGITDYLGADGRRYAVQAQTTRGFQESPFRDETRGNADFRVTNERTGATVGLSDLSGQMISRYGFYQGPGTPYRSAPEDIVRTFGELAEKAGGEAEIKRVVAEVDAYYSAADAMGRAGTGREGRPSAPGTAASRPEAWAPDTTRRGPDVRGR